MDGAFSNNLVSLNDQTVTVSPFYGESDICPKDENLSYFVKFSNTTFELSRRNMSRLVRILIPPSPKVLSQICQQGYDDALEFLGKNNLIKCESCVRIQLNYLSTMAVPEVVEDPEFNCCEEWREKSVTESMPEPVLDVLATNNEGTRSAFKRFIGKPREIFNG
jgi:patatin-like phospholipase domain-containing protein 2